MKRQLTILLFILPPVFAFAQNKNDSIPIHKKNKFGIAFVLSLNTTDKLFQDSYKFKLYNQFYPSPSGYKENFYKNSLNDFFITPSFEINYYDSNNITHSIGIGYREGNGILYQTEIGAFSANSWYFNYAFNYKLFSKKSWIAHPNIAVEECFSKKNITSYITNFFYTPSFRYTWDDNSFLFFSRLKMGCIVNINHFDISTNITCNVLGIISGNNKFDSPSYASPKSEEFHYSKSLFVDRLIFEKYFLQNIQLKIGYIF